MLNNLNVNKSQSIAISHGTGTMLVLAGPGSGKTTVITQRIKYLIEEHHVPPETILVITFTKAAATEMSERFIKLTKGKNYAVNFGTFHSIFFQILRHTYKFTPQNIIHEKQKYELLRQILFDIPPDLITDEFKDINIDNDILQGILSEISVIKNGNIMPDEFKSNILTSKQIQYIYKHYKTMMNHHKLIDFDDMILLCHNLFKERPQVLKLWQEKFKYILIDEFQDINSLQYEITKMLSKPEDNLFIVGDDDQSIYGFRGSRPEIMLNFTRDYPNARQVLLDVNYRSKKDIVELADKLILHNKQRFLKKITVHNSDTNGVKIYSFTSKDEQAKNIALLIKQYMSLEGSKYSDIAILYRTNNSIVSTVQKLVQERIPFVLKEKAKNIYETTASKDIISYLRYSLEQRNVADFHRIMNRPVRYIKRNTVPIKPFSMQELLQNNKATDYVVKNIIRLYKDLFFIKNLTPYLAINYIRKGIGYDNYAKEQKTNFDELDELQNSAKDFETIQEFLDYIEDSKEMLDKCVKPSDDDAIDIVTMHASKGLEWKIVIIPDVNEKIVPHKKAVKSNEIEEERRLFYVAMTRAKEKLFIFYISENNSSGILPSRFISELQKG